MFALLNDTELVLGPIEFNYKLINSVLEDELEVYHKVASTDYARVPLYITEKIKLLRVIYDKPEYDSRYQEISLYKYDVIDDNVVFYYEKKDIDLEKIKEKYKSLIANERWSRENSGYIIHSINNTEIKVSTSRESRISLITKLASGNGPYNFKFGEIWLQITSQDISNIITKIDEKVQLDFDWELEKINEINSCSSTQELNSIDFFNIENNVSIFKV